jgi:Tol biopolymer transport system component
VEWPGQPNAMPTAVLGERAVAAATPGRPGLPRLTRPVGEFMPRLLGSRRNLIAVATVVVVLLAGGLYFALSGSKPRHAATPPVTPPVGKPAAHMLAAGQTGDRAAIPWSLIGPGWTLAEVSTAQATSNGSATGGTHVTYLVDPEGGKYRIRTTYGASAPQFLAWSGDAKEALYAVSGPPGGPAASYGLLALTSGDLTPLSLPAGVIALGFTRPDGLNLVAVQQAGQKYRLERYDLQGGHQATIGTMPRPAGAPTTLQRLNALSSPDGTTAVWGVNGDGMQLVSNAGGLIRKLRMPGVGSPKSCTPLSWWSAHTVVAYCNAAGQQDAGRLWLTPVGGGQPTPLTGVSGSLSGQGYLTGAWQTAGAVYITSTTSNQCSGAPSGPGGQQILQLSTGGAQSAVSIPTSTNNHSSVVAAISGRLLVLSQTSCPGTSSLIWFNPSTHAVQTVLTARSGEVGVVGAVPYGSGPAAVGG